MFVLRKFRKRKRRGWKKKNGSAGDQEKEHRELSKWRSQRKIAEVNCQLL